MSGNDITKNLKRCRLKCFVPFCEAMYEKGDVFLGKCAIKKAA